MAYSSRGLRAVLISVGASVILIPFAFSAPQDARNSAARSKEASIPASYDPLLDLPSLPKKPLSLTGGTVIRVDRVQDFMTIRVFGGGQSRIAYDTRTQFFRDGQKVTDRELQQNARVHIDTMLNGTQVFAKNVWMASNVASGASRGQVLEYQPKSGVLTIRDELSSQPVKFLVNEKTIVQNGGDVHYVADLRPGALVSLTFNQSPQANYGNVQGVSLLAQPGSIFSFFGEITYVDLSKRVLAVENQSDKKSYEIDVLGIPQDQLGSIHTGAIASISAVFDGSRYSARGLNIAPADQK